MTSAAAKLIEIAKNAPAPKRVRICHKWGQGEFHDMSAEMTLWAICAEKNKINGLGTHWLEYDA